MLAALEISEVQNAITKLLIFSCLFLQQQAMIKATGNFWFSVDLALKSMLCVVRAEKLKIFQIFVFFKFFKLSEVEYIFTAVSL